MTAPTALYVRVSTTGQDTEGQERVLREYAASKGWVVGRVYKEKETATGRIEREQYDRLQEDGKLPASERGWNRLLVWALDRWSREDRFTKAVGNIEALEDRGILFSSYTEPTIDSGENGQPNMARDLLRAILPVVAKFEAIRHQDRTQVAMDEITSGRRPTKSGKPVGRPRRVTHELLARIVSLRGTGASWSQVALSVHLPAGTCRNAYSDQKRLVAENTQCRKPSPAISAIGEGPKGQG